MNPLLTWHAIIQDHVWTFGYLIFKPFLSPSWFESELQTSSGRKWLSCYFKETLCCLDGIFGGEQLAQSCERTGSVSHMEYLLLKSKSSHSNKNVSDVERRWKSSEIKRVCFSLRCYMWSCKDDEMLHQTTEGGKQVEAQHEMNRRGFRLVVSSHRTLCSSLRGLCHTAHCLVCIFVKQRYAQ